MNDKLNKLPSHKGSSNYDASSQPSPARSYEMAQEAMKLLRLAIHDVLSAAPNSGLRNSEIGKQLGIYFGHIGHQGHISRSVLAAMQVEGAVTQDKDTQKWCLSVQSPSSS